MVKAVYPGSFDPMTKGHLDVVMRAAGLFDEVIMAVVKQPNKSVLFDTPKRIQLAESATSHLPNVTICSFDGLLVDFAKQQQAKVIVRGLRAISDFEYEFQMSQMNKVLYQEIETVFVMSAIDYTYLSSSMVKEVFRLGGDVSALVPPAVLSALQAL